MVSVSNVAGVDPSRIFVRGFIREVTSGQSKPSATDAAFGSARRSLYFAAGSGGDKDDGDSETVSKNADNPDDKSGGANRGILKRLKVSRVLDDITDENADLCVGKLELPFAVGDVVDGRRQEVRDFFQTTFDNEAAPIRHEEDSDNLTFGFKQKSWKYGHKLPKTKLGIRTTRFTFQAILLVAIDKESSAAAKDQSPSCDGTLSTIDPSRAAAKNTSNNFNTHQPADMPPNPLRSRLGGELGEFEHLVVDIVTSTPFRIANTRVLGRSNSSTSGGHDTGVLVSGERGVGVALKAEQLHHPHQHQGMEGVVGFGGYNPNHNPPNAFHNPYMHAAGGAPPPQHTFYPPHVMYYQQHEQNMQLQLRQQQQQQQLQQQQPSLPYSFPSQYPQPTHHLPPPPPHASAHASASASAAAAVSYLLPQPPAFPLSTPPFSMSYTPNQSYAPEQHLQPQLQFHMHHQAPPSLHHAVGASLPPPGNQQLPPNGMYAPGAGASPLQSSTMHGYAGGMQQQQQPGSSVSGTQQQLQQPQSHRGQDQPRPVTGLSGGGAAAVQRQSPMQSLMNHVAAAGGMPPMAMSPATPPNSDDKGAAVHLPSSKLLGPAVSARTPSLIQQLESQQIHHHGVPGWTAGQTEQPMWQSPHAHAQRLAGTVPERRPFTTHQGGHVGAAPVGSAATSYVLHQSWQSDMSGGRPHGQ
jgi:hypothetical protein